MVKINQKKIIEHMNGLYKIAQDKFFQHNDFSVCEWLNEKDDENYVFLGWCLGENSIFFEKIKKELGFGSGEDYIYRGKDKIRYGKLLNKKEIKELKSEIEKRKNKKLKEIFKDE
jgi:hypothetical protein